MGGVGLRHVARSAVQASRIQDNTKNCLPVSSMGILSSSMKILPSDNSYKTFCDMTTGYRMFQVISEAVNTGVIDLLDDGERTVGELLAATTLQPEAGRRFITLLVNLGLLEECNGKLYLSRFSKSYLSRTSTLGQRHVLAFEPILMENWARLGHVLHEGQGALIREQPQDQLELRLHLFQQAMAEAAAVRSRELWNTINHLPEQGTIIDIGAGDGAYLRGFLQRHPKWDAVACDLPDVCRRMAAQNLPEGLSLYPCNIIDPLETAGLVERYRGRAGLVLFSNLCHCYNHDENQVLLRQAGESPAENGLLLIHDFYRDANGPGALYDLHMLVNTLNGRTYSIAETTALLRGAGLASHSTRSLNCHPAPWFWSPPVPPPFRTLYRSSVLKDDALAHGFFAAVDSIRPAFAAKPGFGPNAPTAAPNTADAGVARPIPWTRPVLRSCWQGIRGLCSLSVSRRSWIFSAICSNWRKRPF